MIRQRVLSPSYVSIGLAITTGLAANLGSALPARAQANLNIQTQLDIILPPVSAQKPESSPSAPSPTFLALDQCVGLKSSAGVVATKNLGSVAKQIKAFATKNDGRLQVQQNRAPLTDQEIKDIVEGFCKSEPEKFTAVQKSNITEQLRRLFVAFGPNPDPGVTTRQPTNVQISFPFNPSYETNTLRSLGNNSSPGESAGFGGNVLITSGVKDRPWDFVILNAQEASQRYAPNFSPSTDGLSQQASYQLFLHAYGYNPSTKSFVDNLVPGSPTPPLPGGTTTFDTATFTVLNQTAFAPTFKNEKTDFLTPQISLARQNIGLDDFSAKPCVENFTTDPTKAKFCYYANASLTAGQSFSDVRTLENVNLAASVMLGWNINQYWGLTLPATATAKDYEHVIGGRRDVLLQVGPVLTYTSDRFSIFGCSTEPGVDFCKAHESMSYSFKIPITYYKNYSTLSAAAWSGWVIMPTLTVSFNCLGCDNKD